MTMTFSALMKMAKDKREVRILVIMMGFGIVFLILCIGNTFINGIVVLVQNSKLAAFESHITEYMASPEVQGTESYIRGKIIVVDIRDKDLDRLLFELPNDLRATRPEEVQTIVWLDCTWSLVGTYSKGGGGYQRFCSVTIIDKLESAIVGTESFRGSSPPGSKSSPGDVYGSEPTDEIVKYIVSMPRR